MFWLDCMLLTTFVSVAMASFIAVTFIHEPFAMPDAIAAASAA